MNGEVSQFQRDAVLRRSKQAENVLSRFVTRAQSLYGPGTDFKLVPGDGQGFRCAEVTEKRKTGIVRHYLMPLVSCKGPVSTNSDGSSKYGTILGDGSVHEVRSIDGKPTIVCLSFPDKDGTRHQLIQEGNQTAWVEPNTRVGDTIITDIIMTTIGGSMTESQMSDVLVRLRSTLEMPQTLASGDPLPDMVEARGNK